MDYELIDENRESDVKACCAAGNAEACANIAEYDCSKIITI